MGEIESVAIASTPIGKKADATDNQADRMKKVRCEKTTDRGMKEANRHKYNTTTLLLFHYYNYEFDVTFTIF